MSEAEYKKLELMKLLRNGDMKQLHALTPETIRQRAGLYAYAWAADATVMRFLTECGVKPTLGEKGDTPLFHCDADKVADLVACGYDINTKAPEAFGETALITAVYGNKTEKVKSLLACGADVNLQNQHGLSALFFAKTPEMTALLLQAGANPHLRAQNGRTALFSIFDAKQARLLLGAGADINAKDNNNQTIFDVIKDDALLKTLSTFKTEQSYATKCTKWQGLSPINTNIVEDPYVKRLA